MEHPALFARARTELKIERMIALRHNAVLVGAFVGLATGLALQASTYFPKDVLSFSILCTISVVAGIGMGAYLDRYVEEAGLFKG